MFIVASALIALFCWLAVRPNGPLSARRIALWVLLASMAELIGPALLLITPTNTFFYNLYWVVEFLMLVAICQATKPLPKYALIAILVLFLGIWCVNYVQLWGQPRFVTWSGISGGFILTGLYLWLLWHVVNSWSGKLATSAVFWVCLAVLVYYGASSPILGTLNYFIAVDMQLAAKLYTFTRVLCVVKFCFMAIACLQMEGGTQTLPTHDRAV